MPLFTNDLELEISHWRAKGIDTLLTWRCTTSDDREVPAPVCRPLCDAALIAPVALLLLPKNAPSNTIGLLLRASCLITGRSGGPTRKVSPKDLRRMTDLCGVLHGQMAKGERHETVRKGVRAALRLWIWAVYGGQNGPKNTVLGGL